MRERLIELLRKPTPIIKEYATIGETRMSIVDAEHIADRLLSEGVIVPPCKVGDTVYCVYMNKVIQGTVRLIRPFISEKETIFKGNIICEVENIFLDDGSKEEIELYVVFEKPYGIERLVYLTREEAERSLERRENGKS